MVLHIGIFFTFGKCPCNVVLLILKKTKKKYEEPDNKSALIHLVYYYFSMLSGYMQSGIMAYFNLYYPTAFWGVMKKHD